MQIRILLVDDHAAVRDGVASLLAAQPDICVLGSFGEGMAAVGFAATEQPDVAIVDVAMRGMNGIEVVRQIHDTCPDSQVLMLSMHANPEYLYQAFLAGARGYVLKESAGSEVVEAVRAVHGGQRYFSRRIDRDAFERFVQDRSGQDPVGRLSRRERQVLQLVVEGLTSAEIGAQLGLSPKSVETYRSRMMQKLELEDLPALVKFAIRNGITSVE